MKARLIAPVVLYCAIALLSTATFAQVKITLPKYEFKPHEQIDVLIANKSEQALSFCVEFGHSSYKSEAEPMETTPTPVVVEKRTDKGWSVLLIGPDIGSSRHAVALPAGEIQHYPMRLSETGEMRVVLTYWVGESDADCTKPPRSKTIRSKVFVVR
jgi:hypothetical protein